MDFALFLRGLLVGFAIAAPVGPIGLLCIQRTLAFGRMTGLATGLGAATADACYGLVAALGVTAVASFLSGQRLWLGLLCSLVLVTRAQAAATWDLQRFEGREYVSLDSIAAFYGFPKPPPVELTGHVLPAPTAA